MNEGRVLWSIKSIIVAVLNGRRATVGAHRQHAVVDRVLTIYAMI